MSLLQHFFSSRFPSRSRAVKHSGGMWEFRTAREDVALAFIAADMRSGFGLFANCPRGKRIHRLTAGQLKTLLSHDHSQFLRPEFAD